MLSLPDFLEKHIVFIESYDLKNLQFRNDNIVVSEGEEVKNQFSCHKTFSIFIVGELSVTSVLIKKILSYGISIILMNRNFEVYCVIGAETEGNFLLRMKQYASPDSLLISQHIVQNKIQNQIQLLKDIRKKNILLKKDIGFCENILQKVMHVKDIQELLGLEGNVSKIFFKNYFQELKWRARLPRTKYDPINTLMDIGYTYLFNFIDAHLRLYGFDTYKGNYHQLFYQRKSLVCDLVEPFRCIIDKELLKAFHLGQIDMKDFTVRQNQYQLDYKHTQKYTKIFFNAILEYKADIFLYIQSYYRAIMKGESEYPYFSIH